MSSPFEESSRAESEPPAVSPVGSPAPGLLGVYGPTPEGLETLRHSAREAAARLHALSHGVSAGVLFLDPEGRVELVNRALCQMLGLASPQEVVGQPAAVVAGRLSERFADPAAFVRAGFLGGESRLRLADGRVLQRELLPVGPEAEGHGVLVLLREVSAAEEGLEEVEPLLTVSLLDELTGLLNRRGFLAQASRRLRRAAQEGRAASLFCVDVDGMKTINDRLGHAVGDEALHEASEVLRRAFAESDLLARLGGDKFGILSLDVDEAGQADAVERLTRGTTLLNARPARTWRLSLSIGAASFQARHCPLVEDLLAVADARLHARKRGRQGQATSP